MSRSYPVVVITTKQYENDPFVVANETVITVDGREWPIFGYKVEEHVDDIQRLTLTFAADVTIVHKEP